MRHANSPRRTRHLTPVPNVALASRYLFVFAIVMCTIEIRTEGHRRRALHITRYCDLLLHMTPRGLMYILVGLTLVAQATARARS